MLLGQISPQMPQIFRPIEGQRKLQKDDVLKVICEYFNSSDNLVISGPRRADEMCAAYLLYYVKANKMIDSESYCIGGKVHG